MKTRELFAVLLLLALAAPLFFFNLGAASLWHPDEPRFVASSRAMLERHDLVTPWWNGHPRFDKPILLYWLILLSYKLFGVSILAARLPVASLALATLWVTYRMGRLLGGHRVGILALLIAATAYRFVAWHRIALTDAPLCLAVALGWLGWARWQSTPERRAPAYLFACAAGLGFLAKGPVALALLGVPALLTLVPRRRWRDLRRFPWIGATTLFAFVSLPWYGAMLWIHGRAYFDYFFVGDNLRRYLSSTFRPRPLTYFAPVLLSDFLPWTLLLLAMLALHLRRVRRLLRPGSRTRLFYLIAVLSTFGFFSLAAYKLPHYLLPLFPPAAALTAETIRIGTRLKQRWFKLSWDLTGLLLLGTAAVAALHSYLVLEAHDPLAYFPALILLTGGLALLLLRRSLRVAAPWALSCCSLFFYLVVIYRILPEYERTKPIPELAARIQQEIQARSGPQARPKPRVILFDTEQPALMWYIHRQIDEVSDPARLVDLLHAKRLAFAITDAEGFDRIRALHPELDLTLLERRTPYMPRAANLLRPELVKDPGRDLVLFSNRPSRLGLARRHPKHLPRNLVQSPPR